MSVLFDHSAEYIECSLKSNELHREYLKRENELLKILSEAYAGMAEDYRGPSKLFRKTNKANIERP